MIKILVVDDDPTMAYLLTASIRQAFSNEVELKQMTDPKAARTWLEGEVVDLLITDLEMPNLSGLDLLRCAKRRNAWTQVLVVTGHSTPDALVDAMECGATDYLLKPFDRDELVMLIKDAQQRLRRWRRAMAATLASC